MTGFDLLVIGDVNADVVVRDPDPHPEFGQVERLVEQVAITLGGSSAIVAAGGARLGLRTAFAGLVGSDPVGRFVVQALAERGIDTGGCRIDPRFTTGATVVLAGAADRAILTAAGSNSALRIGHLHSDLIRRARHIHIGSYFLLDGLRPDVPRLFAAARQAGATTSLDTNWDPSGAWDGGVWQALAETDVFLPNEAEAQRLCDERDLQACLNAIVERAGGGLTVVIKRGASGAVAMGEEGEFSCLAPLIEPVDSTGAGDAFDAGFIYGLLTNRPMKERLAMAVACGSLSTQHVGGIEGQPTIPEVIDAIDSWGLLDG